MYLLFTTISGQPQPTRGCRFLSSLLFWLALTLSSQFGVGYAQSFSPVSGTPFEGELHSVAKATINTGDKPNVWSYPGSLKGGVQTPGDRVANAGGVPSPALSKSTATLPKIIEACALITFSASSEGWLNKSTVNGFAPFTDHGTATWDATEGNPGGTIKDTDRDADWQELQTPPLAANGYDTDNSDLLGKDILFDYKTSTGVTFDIYMAMQGANGSRYFFNFRPQISATGAWSRIRIPMDPAQWTKNFVVASGAGSGNAPTQAEFLAVLSNLDHFAFSIEGISGPDLTYFDNFSYDCVPTLSASSSVVCEEATVSVVGTTASTVTYQWFKDGLSLGTAQQTPTLLLSGALPSQGGQYSLVVTSGVNSATSAAFSLTVNPQPTVTLLFNGATQSTLGPNLPLITLTSPLDPNNLPAFQVFGGIYYERLGWIDQINGYQIKCYESNNTGLFKINQLGPYTITVTGANGCKRTVTGVISN